MAKNLVIVESPAKAKTIKKFLGADYEVASSFGHIRDLPKKDMGVDIEHDFEPTYQIDPGKKKIVSNLKRAAKSATAVWLASDEDREGEAIAWHLMHALGLTEAKTKRIVFHEITKNAILHAVENPRKVNLNLVDAQQARRVLDRLVGYELSPILWRKVAPSLSAGRVQSVAVRLIVERERQIEQFSSEASFRLSTVLATRENTTFVAELPEKIPSEEIARELLEKLQDASLSVQTIEQKPHQRSPLPPFTTSTLQQEASRRLGFSVKRTMLGAQRLYENGHITYMRTDSLNLAESAITAMATEIEKEFGEKYVASRRYKTKSAGAQEAHEAIRPTRFGVKEAGDDADQQKLYRLIRERALASQMAAARVEKTTVAIGTNTNITLVAKGEVIEFDGFLKLARIPSDKESERLPQLNIGDRLELQSALARQVFSRPPARYTEASLVKKLEELGIGRPSTYAPTISTIQDREYVEKSETEGIERNFVLLELQNGQVVRREETERTGTDKNKLIPTEMGKLVNDFLVKFFPDIVDYDFTARVEAEFDAIAAGNKKWREMIGHFYKPFHKTVESTAKVSRKEVSRARELGKDPKTGKPVLARFGRYGPMVQLGESEDEEKPRFAGLPKDKKIETITLEEALDLLKLPRSLGQTAEGEEIIANRGRFGPYVKFGSTYVSIGSEDPATISLEKAQEFIVAKQAAEAKKHIKTFPEGISIMQGPYGPYVTDGKTNARIPKDQVLDTLTLIDCQKLLAERRKRPTKGRRFSKKA